MRTQPPRLTTASPSSALTRPSRICTTRSATAAELGSWLTTSGRRSDLARQRADQRVDLLGIRRVELAGRLVGDEEPRAVRERGADRDALLLAARELCRQRIRAVEQADAFEQAVGGALALRALDAEQREAQRDELPHASARARARGA